MQGGGVLGSWDAFPQALDDYCATYEDEEKPVSPQLKEKLLIIYQSFKDSGFPAPALWGHGPDAIVFNWPHMLVTVSEKHATCLITDNKDDQISVNATASPIWTVPKLNAHIARYFEKDIDLQKASMGEGRAYLDDVRHIESPIGVDDAKRIYAEQTELDKQADYNAKKFTSYNCTVVDVESVKGIWIKASRYNGDNLKPGNSSFDLDDIPPIRLLGDITIDEADKRAIDRAMQNMVVSVEGCSSHIDQNTLNDALMRMTEEGHHRVIVIDSLSTPPPRLIGGSMGISSMTSALLTAITLSEMPEPADDHFIPRKYRDYQQPKSYGPPRKKRW
ncbi:unnamed protein product [Sphagnum balticum]